MRVKLDKRTFLDNTQKKKDNSKREKERKKRKENWSGGRGCLGRCVSVNPSRLNGDLSL